LGGHVVRPFFINDQDCKNWNDILIRQTIIYLKLNTTVVKGKIMSLAGWLRQAPEYFNRWRVFPRGFIILYFWLCVETALWFMGLPVPTPSQAAFAGTIITAGAAWFGLYVNSGSKIASNALLESTSPTSVILSVQTAPSSETKSDDVPVYYSKG
jgi:hypothetical protein